MGIPRDPEKVKLFMGVLYSSETFWLQAEKELVNKFRNVDLRTSPVKFAHTGYYTKEMGTNIMRCFISFEPLINPDQLPLIKIFTNTLETNFINKDLDNGRLVNLDPGYMSHANVVLATTKNYSHRVYLGSGIYAELALRIRGKDWSPMEWTYPDYRVESNLEFFRKMRKKYLVQRKRLHSNNR